jgi:hypothetical protein
MKRDGAGNYRVDALLLTLARIHCLDSTQHHMPLQFRRAVWILVADGLLDWDCRLVVEVLPRRASLP